MRPFVILMVLLVLQACGKRDDSPETIGTTEPVASTALPTDVVKSLRRYETQARELLALMDDDDLPLDEIEAHVDELTTTAQDIMPAIAAIDAQCNDQLIQSPPGTNAAATDSAITPRTDIALCEGIKELLVGPATALNLLKQNPTDPDEAQAGIKAVIDRAVALQNAR